MMTLTTFNYLLTMTNKIKRKSKKSYLIFGLSIVFLIIFGFSRKTDKVLQLSEMFQRSLAFNKFNTSNEQTIADEWQYIGDPKERYQIYSAYFDSRLEMVGE